MRHRQARLKQTFSKTKRSQLRSLGFTSLGCRAHNLPPRFAPTPLLQHQIAAPTAAWIISTRYPPPPTRAHRFVCGPPHCLGAPTIACQPHPALLFLFSPKGKKKDSRWLTCTYTAFAPCCCLPSRLQFVNTIHTNMSSIVNPKTTDATVNPKPDTARKSFALLVKKPFCFLGCCALISVSLICTILALLFYLFARGCARQSR